MSPSGSVALSVRLSCWPSVIVGLSMLAKVGGWFGAATVIVMVREKLPSCFPSSAVKVSVWSPISAELGVQVKVFADRAEPDGLLKTV